MASVRKNHSRDPAERRRRDLAIIHLAKKQLGIGDELYLSNLREVTGLESAAQLDDEGRKKLIAFFINCGFRPAHSSARRSGMHRSTSRDRVPLLSKIGAILADLRLPWTYADGIARRMFKADLVRWLYPDQLQAVLVALLKLQEKRQRGEVPCER